MNKAGKHIQSGSSTASNVITSSSPAAPMLDTQRNVLNSIMSFLPDNRPITALQIVEDFEKCPKNFTSICRTYDQDSDADLWRENNILFGRQTTRYLCLSKTEGLPEYVVETLKVIAEKIQPPKEFSLLLRTTDSEQKAWRNRKQIIYKLSKRGTVTHAVTDIILCSKLKTAPDGFKLAGDINGILVCYKTGAVAARAPPPVPLNGGSISEVEKALNRLNVNAGISTAGGGGGGSNRNSGNWNPNQPLPPVPNGKHGHDHDYEEIQTSPLLLRPAPRPPQLANTATNTSGHSVGTLGAYSELDGVPFAINPSIKQTVKFSVTLPETVNKELDYDFQLERQILCTMKSAASKNPFFK